MGGSHSFLTYAVIESRVTQISQRTQILTCSVWDFADFGYFADNLQNFCFFLGGFEENA